MATLTIKNVPPELYELLKQRAGSNRRSINSEAIRCLELVLESERLDVEEWLEETRKLRAKWGDVELDDQFLRKAKDLGRL